MEDFDGDLLITVRDIEYHVPCSTSPVAVQKPQPPFS